MSGIVCLEKMPELSKYYHLACIKYVQCSTASRQDLEMMRSEPFHTNVCAKTKNRTEVRFGTLKRPVYV